jgi:WD40 repeat protein
VLWRYASGQLHALATRRRADKAYAVAFSPDGSLLAAAGADQTVSLWDISNPLEPVTIRWPASQSNSIFSLQFSSDGRILFAGDGDGGICIYDVEALRAGGSVRCLTGSAFGDASIDALAFDPTTNMLVSAGRGVAVVAWKPVLWGDGTEAELENAVCRLAQRNLTQAEWSYAFKGTKLAEDWRPTCPT